MADDGYDEAAERISEYVPRDDVTEADIREALETGGFFDFDDPSSRQEALDAFEEAVGRQTVRDDSGKVAGRRENLSTWVDRWGNVMRYNRETGTFKKLIDEGNR